MVVDAALLSMLQTLRQLFIGVHLPEEVDHPHTWVTAIAPDPLLPPAHGEEALLDVSTAGSGVAYGERGILPVSICLRPGLECGQYVIRDVLVPEPLSLP